MADFEVEMGFKMIIDLVIRQCIKKNRLVLTEAIVHSSGKNLD